MNDDVETGGQETVEGAATHDPSVTTGSESAAAPKDTTEEQSDDLSYLAELLDEGDDYVEEGAKDKAPAEVKPEEKPVEKPAELEEVKTPETVEQKPEAQVPEQKEQSTQEAPQQPQAVEQPAPSMSPEEASRVYGKFFEDSVGLLASRVYALDEETKEKLDSAPSEVMPQLAARLHMQVLTATLTQAANLFPMLMTEHLEKSRDYQAQEDKFFGEFPDLKAHRAQVERVAAVYRQLNPRASYEEATKQIAAMTRVQLQLPIPSLAPQVTPPVPVAPPTPSSAKGGAAAPKAPTERSTWDELIEEE